MKTAIDEKLLIEQTEKEFDGYAKKYKRQFRVFESSLVSKATNLSSYHYVQLAKMFERWERFTKMHEVNGSLNSLGELPKVAIDVITATMSNSILPVIALTQVLESQKNFVLFKNLKALDTKGNMTSGDIIINPRTGLKTPSAYASGEVVGEIGATGNGVLTTFSFNLNTSQPVRKQYVKVYLSGGVIFAKDFNGDGKLYGTGCFGTVNYDTGAVSITFGVAPANLASIFADYVQNLEEMPDVKRMNMELDSTDVEAIPYALKSVMSIFQQFEVQKRFGGDSYFEDLANDLTKALNAEIGGDMIRKYNAEAGISPATTFSLTAPVNVSEKLHRESYAFRMADAESTILSQAGRGAIKIVIAGREQCAVVRGLDGFQLLSDATALGPHIFGTYKGVTYIRVPESALMPAKEGIAMHSGDGNLEGAGIYAPYMPLIVQDAPLSPNPLNSQKVVATMCATKVLIPQFLTKLNVIP